MPLLTELVRIAVWNYKYVTPTALKFMNLEFLPPNEIEKQRNDWFRQRAKPGITFDEFIRLNDEVFNLYPRTEEERRRKTESLEAMQEFVL
jgi:hypothetical protein